MRKNILKLLVGLGIITALALIVRALDLTRYLDKDVFLGWVSNLGAAGPLTYIAVYAIAPTLLVPGFPLTIAGGLAFGPLWGTIYASLGSTIGACLPFLVARYFARDVVVSLMGDRLRAVDEGVAQKGWVYVAITRLIPLFPFEFLNYAFGLTKITFTHYIVTSWVCMLPGTVAYVVLASSVWDLLSGRLSGVVILGVVLLSLILAIPFFYKRKRSSALSSAAGGSGGGSRGVIS